MAKYYPKSQIIPNLYAANGENNGVEGTLINTQTKNPHTGFFWSTADGKYYTGKTPSDLPNAELIIDRSTLPIGSPGPLYPKLQTKSTIALFLNDPEVEIRGLAGPTPSGNPDFGWVQYDIVKYAQLKGITINDPPEFDNPYTNPVIPEETDYKRGSFKRYFAKKRNANLYIEIDKSMYDNISGKKRSVTYYDYLAFDLIWTLTGNIDDVKEINKNSIDLANRTYNLSGFYKFLQSDYLKYYGLYTEGGEYKLSNGKIYMGLYHIHPDKGAMVGRVHVETPHDNLTPIDQPIQISASISQPTQTTNPISVPSPSSGGNYSSGY